MREARGRSGTFRGVVSGGGAFLLLFLSLAVRAGAAGEPAGSRPNDPGRQAIEITADRMSADSARDSVTFEGNVVAHQADVTLHADRLYAEYSRASREIEKITAEGNVRVIQGDKEARAARAVFYTLEQRIVLTGGAELAQGENLLKGDTVTVYLRENRSVVTGGEGGRVRAVIQPQSFQGTKEKENR
jgi:lipopolysaccharide export system protein LptA